MVSWHIGICPSGQEPPLYFQFEKEAEYPAVSWLMGGYSWLCQLPHSCSPKAQATQSGDLGGQRDEEFHSGCTFLPCLWGGQQRNPISTACVCGWETGAFVFLSGVPGSTHSSVSRPRSFQEGARTPANSHQ